MWPPLLKVAVTCHHHFYVQSEIFLTFLSRKGLQKAASFAILQETHRKPITESAASSQYTVYVVNVENLCTDFDLVLPDPHAPRARHISPTPVTTTFWCKVAPLTVILHTCWSHGAYLLTFTDEAVSGWWCAAECMMPSEWRGTWLEAGVGDVTITAHGVLSKGYCVDNINDYYLLDNRCPTSYTHAHYHLLV